MEETQTTFTLKEIIDELEEARKWNLRSLKREEAFYGQGSESVTQLQAMIAEDKLLKMRFEKLYSQKTGSWYQ